MGTKLKRPCGPPCGKGIGGQAVIEGVMMKGRTEYVLAVRDIEKKTIKVEKTKTKTAEERPFLFRLPIIRGVVAFVDSLIIGMKTITRSAQMAGLEDMADDINEEEMSKFEKWLTDKLGDKLMNVVLAISVVFSIVFSVALFMVLPVLVSSFFNKFLGLGTWALGIIEGFTRICIFLFYICLTSLLKDIKRLYKYHGAEHKTINCFESGEELTVENVRQYTRLHKRCGTSFLFLVMIISMIVFLFLRTDVVIYRILSRIIFVPVVAGLSYEVIRWAGKNDNIIVDIVSAPGKAVQLITTKEPDDEMIEVAIASLKGVLEDEPEQK
ncbi:MAG: DUF1385 domain-containing protein [Clostridiales bacterium]|nr:DUF1385 domain-containing protein [Clostridiales bacterium]